MFELLLFAIQDLKKIYIFFKRETELIEIENEELEEWMMFDMLSNSSHSSPCNQQPQPVHRMPNRDRRFSEAHDRIWADYFAQDPLYDEDMFKRRFRCSRSLFNKILAKCDQDVFFHQKPDATGKMGASALQKVVAAFRYLCYGTSYDSQDEYCKIAASTVLQRVYAIIN